MLHADRIKLVLCQVLAVALVLLAWEWYANSRQTVFFPPFSTVWSEFLDRFFSGDAAHLFTTEEFRSSVGVSMGRFARGWFAALVVGIAAGVVLGTVDVIAKLYEPVVRFFIAVPKVALIPIAVQVFGVSGTMNAFLIFFGSVWAVLINTAEGVRGIDATYWRTARSLHLSRRATILKVAVPAASTRIFAGARVSLGIALVLMVVSEIYATISGLGFDIVYAERTFKYPAMWAALLLVALIGIALNGAFSLLERRVLRWDRRAIDRPEQA